MWEFLSGKAMCCTANEPKGIETLISYVLSCPVANVEDINMKYVNLDYLSVTSTRVSLIS